MSSSAYGRGAPAHAFESMLLMTSVASSALIWVHPHHSVNDFATTAYNPYDRFLNFKIDNIRVLDEAKHPHMVSLVTSPMRTLCWIAARTNCSSPSFLLSAQMAVKSAFIRGSVVRYVHIPAAAVDTQLLEDATRRGTFTSLPSPIIRSEFLSPSNHFD